MKYILFKNLFVFVIAAMILIFSSCEKKSDTVIDPNYSSPILSNIYKSKDTVRTSSFLPGIQFNTSLDVNPNNGSQISEVLCKIYDSKNILLASYSMIDNGASPDSIANDNRFSASINITDISCLLVGQYSIVYSAKNVDGLTGNVINSFVYISDTTNFPPVLFNPIIPDSVIRPASGLIELTLKLSGKDTNGICDINSVYFDAYRPNGNYIGRNVMLYEGNSVWKYTNYVGSATADSLFGYYKYSFQAIDNSNALSLFLIDSIKFVRP